MKINPLNIVAMLDPAADGGLGLWPAGNIDLISVFVGMAVTSQTRSFL